MKKMMSRTKSESSKMLKSANKKGHIDIRIKDGGKPSNIDPPKNVGNDLDDFKKEIIEEMKDLLTQKPEPQQPGRTP